MDLATANRRELACFDECRNTHFLKRTVTERTKLYKVY